MGNQFNTLDFTEGPIQKTGQLIDRTPAGRTTKDDGGLQRGVPGSKSDQSYNILTTGQYSGTTNITVNGFTDAHTNECVHDKITSLMWNREHSPAIYGSGSDELFWTDTVNNEDIFEYCDRANLSNLSGFNDWRIPNIYELYSLIKADAPSGVPNSTAFPVFTALAQWNSTTRPDSTGQASRVGFTSINAPPTTKTGARESVMLCRLGIEQ